MPSDARQSPIVHFQAYHACVEAWARSGYRDHSALDGAAPALAAWLSEYPAQADQIQQLAISGSYSAAAFRLHHLVEETARVGLDAALIRPEVTHDDTLALAVVALILAEALLAQDRAAECQRMLDYGRVKIASIETIGPVAAYLELHLSSLAGVFAEAMLEYGIAADHYRRAMESGLPLLDDPAQMRELGRAWTPLLFGSGPDLIPDGAAQSAALLESDIRSAGHRAILGLSRTAQEGAVEAAQGAIRFVRRHGLPQGGNPFDLRRALLSLPFAELQKALPDLLALADDTQLGSDTAAWKVLFHTTAAAHPGAPARNARQSRAKVARLIGNCHDALTLTIATGDLMTASLTGPRPGVGSTAYRDGRATIDLFVTVLFEACKRLVGSTAYLPFKALLDAPIGQAVEWLFDCQRERPSGDPLLSILLDALRTRDQDVPPLESDIGPGEQGLYASLDRLGRLGFAMTERSDTAAIVLQTVGEDTLFFCATGDPTEPLSFERAGPAYQAAARQLTNALRASLSLPADGGPARGLRPREAPSAGPSLDEAGIAAFSVLPERVRELVAGRRALIWLPDFRSDQDDVPFELFHDGTIALGLAKVMARALSLRELLWAIEPQVLPPHTTRRALVVAAPHVPGFAQLTYSERESQDIRAGLIAAGLQSPELPESELDATTLLYACERAGVVHIAAHGVTFAGGEALVLSHDERLLASDIERKPQFLRSFVFLNTCSLGQSRYLGGGVSRGIAYALVRGHAPAVVANLLPVYDRSSAELSIEFYKEARTATVGEALRRARASLKERGVSAVHWGCTVLIGDPGHVLPAARVSAAGNKRKRDTAARLMDAYTNPRKSDTERAAALSAAVSGLTDGGGNPRLFASMDWVQGASAVDPRQPADPESLNRLAALAHEIGNPAGEALMLSQLARRPPEGRSDEERLGDLDAAIRSVEPLAGYGEPWSSLLRDSLSAQHRLLAPQEPPVIDLGDMRVNDQTIPEVRLFFDVQRSVDQEQIRHGREARARLPETTLEDVAWNSVVIHQHYPFDAAEAHVEFAALLTEKLCAKGLLAPAAANNARQIIAGFLPYLWSKQRIIHLDRELAVGQAAVLSLVLGSIAANWTPPEGSPAYPLVSDLPGRIDRMVRGRKDSGQSRYLRALMAISTDNAPVDELSTLGTSLRGIIEGTPGPPTLAAADCAAWIVGLLLEKSQATTNGEDSEREAARELQRIADDFAGYLEGWFMPYLVEGFASLRTAPLSILDLW
jgi:hypothetical protein